VVGECGKYVN